jgi:AraC family transcriptional regulator
MKILKAGQFYGKTSQALATGGFRFTEKKYSPDVKLPVHGHELSHFCFVLAGNYREKIGSREFERQPATLVFYPPDASHTEEHFIDGRHLLVEIDSNELERLGACGARFDEPGLLGDGSALWLAARMYREFCERDAFSALALESITTELLIDASRKYLKSPERKPPVWLAKAKEYLRENFSAPPGLNELAIAVGVHPTHLARVFRRFERCTVGEYVRRICLERARQKMISTGESLIEIALAAGFADQTHFTRTFKKHTGMTPAEFRKIFRAR